MQPESTSSSSSAITCPICKSELILVTDPKSGDNICNKCGMIMSDKIEGLEVSNSDSDELAFLCLPLGTSNGSAQSKISIHLDNFKKIGADVKLCQKILKQQMLKEHHLLAKTK